MNYNDWFCNNIKIDGSCTVKLLFDDSLIIINSGESAILCGVRVVDGFFR